MKKQLFTLFAAIGLLNSVNAQVSPCAFTQTSGTYAPITGGIVLGSATNDEEIFVAATSPLGSDTAFTGVGFPIGFNFTYNGIIFDRFAVNTNGWISLGQSALTPSVNITSSGTTDYSLPLSGTSTATPALLRNRIAGFACDFVGRVGSELRVETTGNSPNKICVIQWKNYKKYGSGDTSHYNFQIRLNETSNQVSVVYGAMIIAVSSTVTAIQVGLGGTVNTDFNIRTTTTDWAATTVGGTNLATCSLTSTIFPASGLTFTWTPASVCSGTPVAGIVTGPGLACSGMDFNLSVPTSSLTGITYNWQSSSTGLAGSFINLVGATSASFDTSQTAATWYQCIVTCTASGLSDTSNTVSITMDIPSNCYCISTATNTTDEEILNVTLGTLNNTSTCTTTGGSGSTMNEYSNYTSLTATDLPIGASVPFSVQIGTCGTSPYPNLTKIFIDYDKNGSFGDAGETVYSSATTGSGAHIELGNIAIPLTATLGNTRMRVVNMEKWAADSVVKACGTYGWGETEDYTVNIASALLLCDGAPEAGQAFASDTSVCSATTITFQLAGYTSNASGIKLQWQSSPTGVAGSFTNIAGDTLSSFSTVQTATTWYQCVVTCSASSLSATSNIIAVYQKATLDCYCASSATSASDEDIFNVTIGTLNNTSSCTTTGGAGSVLNEYSNFTSIAPPSLPRTANLPFSVQVGTCGTDPYTNYVKVFIDYNQNGSFDDAGETAYSSAVAGFGAHIETGSISVPLTATLGNTRMRVVNRETSLLSNLSACGTYSWGETEDYTVTIAAVPPPCSGTPTAGIASASADTVCNGTNINLALIGYTSTTSGITFQWQSSLTGVSGSFTNIVGATNPFFVATQTANTWYQCLVSCTASSLSATSNAITVYQFGLANCYCTPLYSAACSSTDNIDSVGILTTTLMNYGTGCTSLNGVAYTSYPAIGATTASVTKGTTYTLRVTTKVSSIVSVWIDYNQNGVFEASEWKQVFTTSLPNVGKTVSITIPLTAATGKTIMRIRSRKTGNPNDASSSCVSFGSGETEDYTITINPAVGISEYSFANLEIYPNPTTGMLSINFQTESNKLNVKLVNIEGQIVYNENVDHFSGVYSSTINIGENAKGIYFLQITSDNKVTTKKVVLY